MGTTDSRRSDTRGVRPKYARLLWWATPPDEMCSCPDAPPIKLYFALPNPIHCLNCNLEVDPASLPLPEAMADAVADWALVAGSIYHLELDSGAYEAWARRELFDQESAVNRQGFELRQTLDPRRRCYLCFFQANADEDYVPPRLCPVCSKGLTPYEEGIFEQLLCERCGIVLSR